MLFPTVKKLTQHRTKKKMDVCNITQTLYVVCDFVLTTLAYYIYNIHNIIL